MNISEKFSGFKSAERPSTGLALIFDISSFTKFFNKPDIHYYITDYINTIIDCVEIAIWGGDAFWSEEEPESIGLNVKPVMRKFLGDGMLYVWENDENQEVLSTHFKMTLLARLWNIQLHFDLINKSLYEMIPIWDLPPTVKFGIAQGSISRLVDNDGYVDFVGPCINLASRLVKYCPEFNFVASARLNLDKKTLEDFRFVKVIANELRNFENEIVIVDKDDFEGLNDVDKERLFKYLPG